MQSRGQMRSFPAAPPPAPPPVSCIAARGLSMILDASALLLHTSTRRLEPATEGGNNMGDSQMGSGIGKRWMG